MGEESEGREEMDCGEGVAMRIKSRPLAFKDRLLTVMVVASRWRCMMRFVLTWRAG